MESIDGAGEFRDSSVDINFAACERSMKQVVLVFKHLGKAWKVIMQSQAVLLAYLCHQEMYLAKALMAVPRCCFWLSSPRCLQ